MGLSLRKIARRAIRKARQRSADGGLPTAEDERRYVKHQIKKALRKRDGDEA